MPLDHFHRPGDAIFSTNALPQVSGSFAQGRVAGGLTDGLCQARDGQPGVQNGGRPHAKRLDPLSPEGLSKAKGTMTEGTPARNPAMVVPMPP
jgi:hypothetical protein